MNRVPTAPLVLLWGVGILARLVLLPLAPELSDDIYRYLWTVTFSWKASIPTPIHPNTRPRGDPDRVARRDQPPTRVDHLSAADPDPVRAGEPGRGDHPRGKDGMALLRPGMRGAAAGDRRAHRTEPGQGAGLVPVVAAIDRGDGVERALRRGGAVLLDGGDPGGSLEAPRGPWCRPRPGRPGQVRARRRPAAPGAPLRPTHPRRVHRRVRDSLPPFRGSRCLRAHRGSSHLCAALVGQ